MALRIIDYSSEDYGKMVELRREILRKPLGIDYAPEDLEREKEDILIGAFEEDRIVGCCILTKLTQDTCKLRQMAVHSKVQRNGLGGAMLQFAENVARDAGYRKMVLNARKTALGFYEKLGYQQEGNQFLEVSLPHFKMHKSII